MNTSNVHTRLFVGVQRTALYWACTRGYEAAAKVLMEKGAKVEAQNTDQLNCLDIAVERGHEYVDHCTILCSVYSDS